MSLSQQLIAKHNWQCAYGAKQVLANESLVAQSQQLAMYTLMERAGSAAFGALIQCWPKTKSILVICGKGNNGGDGFVVARFAHLANMKVTVLLSCTIDCIKGDALTAYQAMLKVGVKAIVSKKLTKHINEFSGDVIVDALFGIGFYGELAEPMQQLVDTVNAHNAKVLSVDIPSGLCATTGFVNKNQAIVAQLTVSFIVYKQGLLTGQAANYIGELLLADLGLGAVFKQQVPCSAFYQQNYPLLNGVNPLKKRANTSHKGTIGRVLTIGGGNGMPGAIRLASEAALRCGAALVAVCCSVHNQSMVFNGRPELMLAPSEAVQLANSSAMKKAAVILLGPGLGQTVWSQALFEITMDDFINTDTVKSKEKIAKEKYAVVDADALVLLSKTTNFCKNWVLTPHPKEAAILLGCDVASIEEDRFSAVQKIAKKYGGICVLKGAGSLISDGEQVVINSTGNAGMASGGMGDVLSGIIAALILQAHDKFSAVCMAVYIHGAAGDIIADNQGQCGMLASDLFTPLQKLVNLHSVLGEDRKV